MRQHHVSKAFKVQDCSKCPISFECGQNLLASVRPARHFVQMFHKLAKSTYQHDAMMCWHPEFGWLILQKVCLFLSLSDQPSEKSALSFDGVMNRLSSSAFSSRPGQHPFLFSPHQLSIAMFPGRVEPGAWCGCSTIAWLCRLSCHGKEGLRADCKTALPANLHRSQDHRHRAQGEAGEVHLTFVSSRAKRLACFGHQVYGSLRPEGIRNSLQNAAMPMKIGACYPGMLQISTAAGRYQS